MTKKLYDFSKIDNTKYPIINEIYAEIKESFNTIISKDYDKSISLSKNGKTPFFV